MTYRELVYMIMDEVKLASDDAYFTEDHVIFLIGKARAYLLKQLYTNIKKEIPESNYQTICLNLELEGDSNDCAGEVYLRSKETVPASLDITTPKLYNNSPFKGVNFVYTTKERIPYTGNNKFLKNIIYCALGSDNRLVFKSMNPQHQFLEKVQLSGVFEDPQDAANLLCDKEGNSCDIMESKFPLEEGLVFQLIDTVLKELLGASYRPNDNENDAKDSLSTLVTFLRQNLKSNMQKQIEGS